jgi:glyoxylase-like metal-dependent hydrolase (beta-lactamase superfamily II)/ferredoxin
VLPFPVARLSARLSDNAPGDFFVDDACIDCETCRILAPRVFERSDRLGLSVVARQPASAEDALRAKMAIVSCPTSAIGTASKVDVKDAVLALPERIAPDVYYCGYASESSFGAASYLVRRDDGNVLVDSPRAARPLMDRIEALGGVRTMFLTHRDDVADHARFARRFGCERVMHSRDVGDDTRAVERRIEGGDPMHLAADLVAIPTPGHTRGSMVLLVGGTFLFTGDHVWASEDGEDGERLEAGRDVCWYSWAEQTRSMEKLLAFDFEWVLPGHGPRFHAPARRMRAEMERLVGRMKG